ncbi:uncharacterized protein LOC128997090 [Macrosteles quadrilineatus]|uniref:uncharacterized protein LOC128997090 n=1 Tax=Macrosteles quadrilineatus TaxID=74068 RepID=UPI0023E2BED4|nr:uncharacterized protein LOC128997090 [Macrosteles quadrilineatus]
MASKNDVLDEQELNASDCVFFDANSCEMKLNYKLKFPGTYMIPTTKILDLLDNQVLFNYLQLSVESYVKHAREMHMANKSISSRVKTKSGKGISTIGEFKENLPQTKESIIKSEDVFEVPRTASNSSTYDSFHSINIPWHSSKSTVTKSAKPRAFRRKKSGPSIACKPGPSTSSSMTDSSNQESQTLLTPLRYKYTYAAKPKKIKENVRLFTNYDKKNVSEVIILDD